MGHMLKCLESRHLLGAWGQTGPGRIGVSLGMLFLLWGCCSARTQVLPRDKDYVVLGHSDSESCAFEKCKEKAEEYCSQRGKRFVLVQHESSYQGMDRTVKGVMQGAGALMNKPVWTNSSEDYKVSMVFRCR